MPNSLTSSFASAAAGATPDTMNRREGSATDGWSRPRVNGTQTFRRPSTQSRDNLNSSSNTSAGPYIPPHLNQQGIVPRNGMATDMRYSREDCFNIYSAQKDAGLIGSNISQYFAAPWDVNGPQDGFSTKPDSKDLGPQVCWNPQPYTDPLGLQEMDEEEKQTFTTSVNSPLKMNNPKEGQSTAPGGRKTSMSQVNTSTTMRPGTRRRETSDSFTANTPLSPAENKSFRNDPMANTPPPPALLRRRTDYQDEAQEKEDTRHPQTDSPFASLRRSGTAGPPGAGLNPSSASPWSAGPSSAFGSMGAFGALGADSSAGEHSQSQRPGFGTARSTSRFKDILTKPNEDMSPSVKEKASFNALEKLPEEDDATLKMRETLKTRPNRSETNPYDDLMPRAGSAAHSAHDEHGIEQVGFSAFNSSQTPHHRLNQDPASPTNTNPYQSPHTGRMHDDDGSDPQSGMQSLGRRDVFAGADHRAQNSFGSMRGMSGSGFAGVGSGWGNPGFGTGTPGRERPPVSAAFGSSVFSPLTDLQSPGAFGGNSFFGGGPAFGGSARQGGLGLPFPPAMQDQMRSDSRNDAFGGRRDVFEAQRPDPFRGAFDDMRPSDQDTVGRPPSIVATSRQTASASPHGSDQDSLPTAQQRQMVMPDRMRWVYRDPHGHVQGPWSGLEMHDWFKAGFFTAELQVKKLEDSEYEPLAQLVRRIGNSREPFLVPQIGVPHGKASSTAATNPFTVGAPSSSAQPPFANSFPSFGTTLTADQQNALERRKQEEQFLMAQQKEFLAQRQVLMQPRHGAHTGSHMHPLQHHSSAHSLHSQPSFGSITSPAGYQPSPMQAPIQPPHQGNAYQGMPPSSAGLQSAHRDDDLQAQFGRMGLEGRGPYSANPPNQQSFAAHERNRLSMESQQAQQYAHENTFLGQEGRNERLEEFHELRQDMEEDDLEEELLPQPIGSHRPNEDAVATLKQPPAPIGLPRKKQAEGNEQLSLTQQVQRTAAANKQAAEEKAMIEPPPVSTTPLPAPAAQRSRPPVAEQLAAESRSAAQTPIETQASGSIAPWADKTTEMAKGPSLREIQEAEAKRAAAQEAILMEARRAQMEQERLVAAQVAVPAPGLPSSSTWATSGSPGTPTTPGGGVWAKPVVAKPVAGSVTKKTLAQIQKEEEARKQRVAAQAVANAQTQAYANTAVPAGNRYAQMASKVTTPGPTPALQSTGIGAWTTVGASGKPKTPATVVAAPTSQRVVSSSTIATPSVVRPPPSRSTSLAGGTKDKAKDELVKWAKATLANGLKSDINIDDFVRNLLELPADAEMLHEAVYFANSKLLDSRKWAEEFIRRRKLAEKGIVEADSKPVVIVENKSSNGGWNEVAKKGPIAVKESETPAAGFKVVSKKKGKR